MSRSSAAATRNLAWRLRRPRQWRIGDWTLVAGVLLSAGYLILSSTVGVPVGGVISVALGIVAALLALFCFLYGLRRRAPRLASRKRLGTARTWLDLHLAIGLLFLLTTLLHSGMGYPRAPLNQLLFWLALWVVLSGVLGRAIQRWIPRVLSSGLRTEVIYERIPELVDEISKSSAELAARASEPVQALYQRSVARELESPQRRLTFLLDITGGKSGLFKEFDHVRNLLPGPEKAELSRLAELLRAKLALDAHYSLQPLLRLWLILHVPMSLGLLALIVVHIFVAVYY